MRTGNRKFLSECAKCHTVGPGDASSATRVHRPNMAERWVQQPGLRYNKIVIATDADVDGMHIRLLLLSFFLQFFPDVIRNNHLFILQTPLFRVRNKKVTRYCYTEQEKQAAVAPLGASHEITRFKVLAEIS